MSDNTASSGQLRIADEVIASIASTAVLEAEGVAGLAGYLPNWSGDIKGKLSRKRSAKSVTLQINEGKVRVSVAIVVHSGVKIQAVAKDVQQRVKNAVETMTGFDADEVNVHVAGLLA